MKLAITGSNGYIGQNCIDYLNTDFDILALYRAKSRTLFRVRPANVHFKATDYSVEQLKDCFRRCDAILHLASQKAGKSGNPRIQEYYPSITLAENVLQAAYELNIRNIVMASSRCVYGINTATAFHESDTPNPINIYGIYKLLVEEMCRYYNEKKSMKIKVLRLGQVVGRNMNDRSMFCTFLKKVIADETLTVNGIDERDYIYIKDVCNAIKCALCAAEKKGIFNIATGYAVSNLQVAQNMIDEFSRGMIDFHEVNEEQPNRIVLDCNKAYHELKFQCQFKNMKQIISDIYMSYNLNEFNERDKNEL